MLTKEAILERLQRNVNSDGNSQYTYSSNMSVKYQEQELLNELESGGHIQRLAAALGFAVYRLL